VMPEWLGGSGGSYRSAIKPFLIHQSFVVRPEENV
jgi:hypothetical protein